MCFSTTISSIGSISAILTVCPTLSKFLLLVNSGLTIKNSSTPSLLLNATVSIVSPGLTIYSSSLSREPNNKYLVSVVTSSNISSSVDINASFIVTVWPIYIFSIKEPVVSIFFCVSFL